MGKVKLVKEHYDIALHGLWWAVNYGSQLNGYAVYKILESLNYSVLMIMKPDADENDWEEMKKARSQTKNFFRLLLSGNISKIKQE